MKYDKQNEQAVKRGLEWLTKVRDAVEEQGMVSLLRDSMAYAIDLHGHEHFGHRITGDSYGWALVKNGLIIQMEVNEGNHGNGDATEQLRVVSREVKAKGYVGIVLASMKAFREDGRPIMFEVDFEHGVLGITADEIRDNFSMYFKPIS